jgi:Putative phage abortive infection protein
MFRSSPQYTGGRTGIGEGHPKGRLNCNCHHPTFAGESFTMANEPIHQNRNKEVSRLRWGIRISIFLAGVFVILGILVWCHGYQSLEKSEKALSDMGNFGSYLQGTVSSLWSLAVGFLIFVAFLVQKQQLQYQQEELELTRADLEEQQERLEKQERITNRQNFETSFFQLLNLQNQIASQMRQRLYRWQGNEHVPDTIEGRGCFAVWHNNLKEIFGEFRQKKNWKGTTELERVRECYEEFYTGKGHQEDLAHYFRTLYHLIKFVKISDVVVEYKDKRRYTSLVRAQLSAYELALLFYNGLSPYGEGFKPWIEEFGLLEHLDTEHLLLDPSHEVLYDPKAFK